MKHAESRSGFTLVEIMLVVAIIGMLSAITIPAFVKARTTSQRQVCVSSLRQIHSAKEQWAMVANKGNGNAVDMDEVNSYIKGGAPVCPSAGSYTYGVIGTDPMCDSAAVHVLP